MQPGQSLPYLNLSHQVKSLDQTVQTLIQYQRVLYIELLQIKKKLGIEDTPDTAGNTQHFSGVPNNMTVHQTSHRPSSRLSASNKIEGRPEDLDISAIQRALGMGNVKPASTRTSDN